MSRIVLLDVMSMIVTNPHYLATKQSVAASASECLTKTSNTETSTSGWSVSLNNKGNVAHAHNFIAINECVSSLLNAYRACVVRVDFQHLELKTDIVKDSSAISI